MNQSHITVNNNADILVSVSKSAIIRTETGISGLLVAKRCNWSDLLIGLELCGVVISEQESLFLRHHLRKLLFHLHKPLEAHIHTTNTIHLFRWMDGGLVSDSLATQSSNAHYDSLIVPSHYCSPPPSGSALYTERNNRTRTTEQKTARRSGLADDAGLAIN